MKKRLKYVDIARGIAILLVVMGHCDNFKIWSIEKFSALFFMQLFVFISGIFYKSEINNLKELFLVIKKRCLPIYIYYVKFELVFFALTNVFINIGFYNTSIIYGGRYINYISSFNEIIIGIFKIIICMGQEPFCGAFWFLISLIFIIAIYSLINYVSNKFFKNNRQICIHLLVLLCFIIGCIMRYTYSIPRLSPSFVLILFFHLGKLYGNNINAIKFNNTILFIASIIFLNVLYYHGIIYLNKNGFTDPLYLIICSLSGIYVVMYISKFIEKRLPLISKLLSHIGENTLPIMALHFISFKFVMIIQMIFGLITIDELGLLKGANNNNLFYFGYVVVGITIPLIYEYLNRKILKKE